MYGPVTLALDLGHNAAWALGQAGEKPYIGCVTLPTESGEGAAASSLYSILADLFERQRPSIVAVEQRLVGHARTNAAALQRLYGLHFIVAMAAYRTRARFREESVRAVRSWCLPDLPIKERGKPAVHSWAVSHDLAPKTCSYDQTDAVALWAYCVGWPSADFDS